MPPSTRPRSVIGTLSPYPVVVSVTTAHHKACGNELKAVGWACRSIRNMAADERNSTIKNSANTLASALASTTKTRCSWAKPGESCASLSTHNDANSHAVAGGTPHNSAIGTAMTAIRSMNPETEKMCGQILPPRNAALARTTPSIPK